MQTPLIKPKVAKRFNVHKNRGPFTATAKAEQAGEPGFFFALTRTGITKVKGVTVYSCLPGINLFSYDECAFLTHICEAQTGCSIGSGSNLDEAMANMYSNLEKHSTEVFTIIKRNRLFA